MRIRVEVKQDHLKRLVNKRSPISAIAELIWNSLDGDAEKVSVSVKENTLHAIEQLQVSDNGHGIGHERAKETFKNLGASWKRATYRSPAGRELHGRAGEGRFAAFVLGRYVKWVSHCQDNGAVRRFEIIGNESDLGVFEVTDPVDAPGEQPGTTVIISGTEETPSSVMTQRAHDTLAQLFALYLRKYPVVRIEYDGVLIDPASMEEFVKELDVPEVVFADGSSTRPQLTVIEWKYKVDRALHLCDENNFTLTTKHPGIHAPDFDFTAYIQCDRFRGWHESGLLDTDLHPEVSQILESSKQVLRDHFRARSAERAQTIVEDWKAQDVYPYAGNPRDAIETAERQVFDVVALNVNEFLPDFATSDNKSKRLQLRMLKSALERSPLEAQRIIQEVLDLPQDKQEELALILERTTLASIINAAKIVGDRLDFMNGLDAVLFDTEMKKQVKERKHLHRLLAENTWVFGEEFNLSVDDQSLDEVLRKHLKLLGDDRGELAPVTTIDGTAGIVDIMLSRLIPQTKVEEREHLVIELKRPSKRLDVQAADQIEKYAFAVAEDERFRDVNTRWIFWLVSNDMDDHLRRRATKQADRPDGMIHRASDFDLTIWTKTWSQVLEECRSRLHFFQKHLQFLATQDTGLDYLRRTHAKYLPDSPPNEIRQVNS